MASDGADQSGEWVLRRQEDLDDNLRWEKFSDREKAALKQAAVDAGVRFGVGLGATVTVVALAGFFRRPGAAPLPWHIRWLALPTLFISGGYFGALTSLPNSVRRIMALDDSMLGAVLRTEVENWNLASTIRISEQRRAEEIARQQQRK